jgi:hypothetical protein
LFCLFFLQGKHVLDLFNIIRAEGALLGRSALLFGRKAKTPTEATVGVEFVAVTGMSNHHPKHD